MYLDIQSISNWIISGVIGLFFGVLSAWITHRYQRKRDDIAWEHEKEKLARQHEQEKELIEIQFQKKLLEIEKQISQQNDAKLRSELTKGLDNPEKEIRSIEHSRSYISGGRHRFSLNTSELRSVFLFLRSTTSVMEAQIAQVDSAIANARSMKNPQIVKYIEHWDKIKSTLTSDLDLVYQAEEVIDNLETLMADDSSY